MAEMKGLGLSMLFFTLLFYSIILAIFPTTSIGGLFVIDWPYWTALIVIDGVAAGLVGIKVVGSGLTGPSESLLFYAAATAPIFIGMSTSTCFLFTAYALPMNGFIQAIVGLIYGVGLFFTAGEQGGGSGTS